MLEAFLGPIVPRQKGNRREIRRRRDGGLFVDSNDRDRKAEVAVRSLALAHRPPAPLRGGVRLDVTFVFPVPASWSKARRAGALAGQVLPIGGGIPDRGNALKLLEDALQGVFYEDDAQVAAGEVAKVYGEVPGYRVRLTQIGG